MTKIQIYSHVNPWFTKPNYFFSNDNYLDILPNNKKSFDHNLNSITLFLIYFIIFIFIDGNKITFPFIILLIIIYTQIVNYIPVHDENVNYKRYAKNILIDEDDVYKNKNNQRAFAEIGMIDKRPDYLKFGKYILS